MLKEQQNGPVKGLLATVESAGPGETLAESALVYLASRALEGAQALPIEDRRPALADLREALGLILAGLDRQADPSPTKEMLLA